MSYFETAANHNEDLIIEAVLNATDSFAMNPAEAAVDYGSGILPADEDPASADNVLTVDSVLRIRSQLTGSLPVVAVTTATIRDAEPEETVSPGKPLKNPLPQPEAVLRPLKEPAFFMPDSPEEDFPVVDPADLFGFGEAPAGTNPEKPSEESGKGAEMREFDLVIGDNDDFDLKD